MDNSTILQDIEMEKRRTHAKEVNEKLLRKYVIAQIRDFSGDNTLAFIMTFVLVGLGIFTHFQFGLKWPVIVAICSVSLIWSIYNLVISLPLCKGRITITNIQHLQQTLLKYKKYDLIGTAILLPILTGLFIWLAFELYDLFTYRFWKFEIYNKYGVIASVITIIITLIIVLGSVNNTYNTSKAIDTLVADIEECKME